MWIFKDEINTIDILPAVKRTAIPTRTSLIARTFDGLTRPGMLLL
ncbi:MULTISPECIES: hypothetical protein [unclassified Microcystis]|nr:MULTISPECIES: hypothetical protein [unclassified Microcystis]